MRVAALQFDVRRGEVRANLGRALELLREAADRGVELACLPEMWPTSFPAGEGPGAGALEQTSEALERVRELSGELGLVVGGSAFGPGPDPARPTNRFVLFEGGREVARYDKVHLFTPTAEHESFSAGIAPPPVVATGLGRISAAICYDLRFPELLRVAFRGGAQVLLVPAQWPSARSAHWRALCVGHAILQQLVVVGANRVGSERVGRRGLELEFLGGSLVVSPHGEVLAEGGAEEGLVVADVDLDEVRHLRTRVPVAKDERPDLYRRWSRSGGGQGRAAPE